MRNIESSKMRILESEATPKGKNQGHLQCFSVPLVLPGILCKLTQEHC